ncbi:MAG: ABC transporter, partial [Caldimonas sp.]
LDDYQRWLLDQSKATARAARAEAAPNRAAAAPAKSQATRPEETAKPAPVDDRKATALARQQRADAAKPLKKELNQIDNRLGVLFEERGRLEAPEAGAVVDVDRRAENGRRLKTIAAQIELLEARWLELSTQLDDIAESVD